jgi:hypothetical protein
VNKHRIDGKNIILLVSMSLTILVLSFAAIPSTCAPDQDMATEKQTALDLITSVAGVDLTQYTISFPYATVNTPPLDEWSLIIHLNGGGKCVRVDVEVDRGVVAFFKCNDTLLLQSARAGKSTLNAARDIVTALCSRIGGSSALADQCLQTLDSAVPDQDQTIVNGNLELVVEGGGKQFSWKTLVYGVEAMTLFGFDISADGHLMKLFNNCGIRSVSTPSSIITEEQAKNIALGYVQDYAQRNDRTVEAAKATLRFDLLDYDRYVFYPTWWVEATFEESEVDQWVFGYGVLMFAEQGSLISHEPSIKLGQPTAYGFDHFAMALFATAVLLPLPIALVVVRRKRHAPNR